MGLGRNIEKNNQSEESENRRRVGLTTLQRSVETNGIKQLWNYLKKAYVHQWTITFIEIWLHRFELKLKLAKCAELFCL